MNLEGSGSTVPAKEDGPRIRAKDRLILRQELQKISGLDGPAARDRILGELRAEIGDGLNPERSDNGALDIWLMCKACLDLNQIEVFVDVLQLNLGDVKRLADLRALVEKLVTGRVLLYPEDRAALTGLLREVPGPAVEAALTRCERTEELPAGTLTGDDGPAVLAEILEGIAAQRLTASVAWRFLELVVHQSGEEHATELHRAIVSAAVRLGSSAEIEQARVCRQTTEDIKSLPAALPTISPETDDILPLSPDPLFGVDDMAALLRNPSPSTVATPAVMRGLPPRNHYFAGREGLLRGLGEQLDRAGEAAVLPQTLHGLGGVGKTQVALEYAYANSSRYDLVFWIPADEEQMIRRSMVSLGKVLDVPETADVQYTIDNTLDELRAGRKYPRWLLVFDNAADPRIIRKYIPNGAGNVLITSRNAEWRSEYEVIEVDVFTPTESREFLKKRWPELTPEQADKLAELLARLPLALNQAAAFHAETGMSLEDYLADYNQLVEAVTETTPSDYPQPVAVTWRLAFERVTQRSLAAAQLLQLCCFLSSEPIAAPMLRAGRGAALPAELKHALQSQLEFRKAVLELGRYALVQIDTARDFITVHSLVRAVLRDALEVEERARIQHMAHEVLAFANPSDPDDSDTWARHRQITPHVEASGVVYSDDEHVRQILVDQIRFHFSSGDYDMSRRVAETTLQGWRRFGADDVVLLRVRFHLANALRMLGEYELSRQETHDTYVHLERVLGAGQEYTLAVANSLGADLRYLGQFTEALEQDQTTWDQHKQASDDPNDVSTLRAANNVAVDLRLLGRFDEARRIDEDNVARRLAADPAASDPETLLAVNNLVRDLIGVGHYREALAFQQERLPAFEARLGQHRNVLVAHRNLAILHRKLGNTRQALELAENLERILRDQPRHESALGASLTLFNTQRAYGELTQARTLGQQTLEAYRQVFNRHHPYALSCAVDLAVVYRALGQHAEAEQLDTESLEGLRRVLLDDHPSVLSCAGNHANNLAHAGRYEEALRLTKDAYERSVRVRVPNHPNTLLLAANLVLDLDAVGEHAKAAQLRKTTIGNLRQVLGPEHPETINVERGRRTEIDIELPGL